MQGVDNSGDCFHAIDVVQTFQANSIDYMYYLGPGMLASSSHRQRAGGHSPGRLSFPPRDRHHQNKLHPDLYSDSPRTSFVLVQDVPGSSRHATPPRVRGITRAWCDPSDPSDSGRGVGPLGLGRMVRWVDTAPVCLGAGRRGAVQAVC